MEFIHTFETKTVKIGDWVKIVRKTYNRHKYTIGNSYKVIDLDVVNDPVIVNDDNYDVLRLSKINWFVVEISTQFQ